MAGPGIFYFIDTITFQIFIPKIYTLCNNHKGTWPTTQKRTMTFIWNCALVFLFSLFWVLSSLKKLWILYLFFLQEGLQINDAKLKKKNFQSLLFLLRLRKLHFGRNAGILFYIQSLPKILEFCYHQNSGSYFVAHK